MKCFSYCQTESVYGQPGPVEGRLKRPSAETILEAIIAVSVIMAILAPASALYISAMRNSAMDKNDLIAQSLADEGVEILRNIRDTNFIKFSSKISGCWNTKPGHAESSDCETDTIAAGSYRLSVNVDRADPGFLQWTLEGATEPLHQNAGVYDLAGRYDEEYRLFLDEDALTPECAALGPPRVPANCHEHFVDDMHLYYHPAADAAADAPSPSPFYREIAIAYEGQAMRVSSRVVYRAGSDVRAVRRDTALTNQPL